MSFFAGKACFLRTFSPRQPRGLTRPGPPGEKQKRRAGRILHSVRSGRFSCEHRHQEYNDKTRPLRQGPDCRIISPCGVALRPLCRWVLHLCRSAGAPTLADCRIFVFQVDYSRIFPAMQAPPLPSPGRRLTNSPPDDKIFPLLQKERERCAAEKACARRRVSRPTAAQRRLLGRDAGHVLRKEVRPYADYATYRTVYRDDCRKKQKPPLWQVTVS